MLVEEKDAKPGVKNLSREFFSHEIEVERWESVYDQQDFSGFCLRARMNQALSWLDASSLSTDSMTLDAGCGAGIVTREVAKREHQVVGIDYSHGMIEKANSVCSTDRDLEARFSQADVGSLPFKDSSFDMILCLGVITYLESVEKVLHEFSRVLKPGGLLILSSLNKAYLAMYLDLPILVGEMLKTPVKCARITLKKILGTRIASRIATWRKRTEIPKGPSVYRRYFTPKLKTSLELQGFSVLEYTTVPLGLLTFSGRTIPPERMNMKLTMFLERLNIPLIGPLGGMCIFRVRKNPIGRPDESSQPMSAKLKLGAGAGTE
jgi:ubiquinone/menaquinone biosynthesis C-methylase UbiE